MSALNSLSAQYTDSEGEDDSHDRPARISHEDPKEEEVQQTGENSNSNFDRPTRLVSYIGDPEDDLDLDDELEAGSDDMDISRSDDEGGEQDGERDAAAGAAAAGEDLIPTEPAGKCSKDLQEMVAKLCQEHERTGADMNDRLRSHKDFHNPSIYEKLITFCDIDEFGTNYPPELYDPSIWGKQSYYDDLARVQKEDMERREKERKERTKVEVVTGTKKLDGEPKRRSKWDQVGAPHGSSVPIIKPAGLATGLPPPAKTIPAFGSIAKKK